MSGVWRKKYIVNGVRKLKLIVTQIVTLMIMRVRVRVRVRVNLTRTLQTKISIKYKWTLLKNCSKK